MRYDIAIQIVNYNTKKYLLECVETVIDDLDGTNLTYTILVLDNNSDDDLTELENRFRDNVSFYYSDKNLGFGAGHNYLSDKASSKYILILNPDVKLIEPNSIERLLKSIQGDVKVVGPKLLTEDGQPQAHDHGELNGLHARISASLGKSYWKNQEESTESMWVSGAFVIIEREVFDAEKGFDENFFLYKEEEDLCFRIREKNYKILYEPSIKVMHYGSVVASKSKFMKKSVEYYTKKHFSKKLRYPLLILLNKIMHRS